MSGMLAKVLNSTVGTNNFKSLDVAMTEKICDRLKSETRLIGSDDVLYVYDGQWKRTDDDPDTGYKGKTTDGFTFSHSGLALFKTTQLQEEGVDWYMYVYCDGVRIEKVNIPEDDVEVDLYFDIVIPVAVEAGKTYSVFISGYEEAPSANLSVCATPVMFAPTVTLV